MIQGPSELSVGRSRGIQLLGSGLEFVPGVHSGLPRQRLPGLRPADGAARLIFRLDPDRTEGTAPALYRYDEKARHLVKQSGQQRSGSTITATATADGSAKYVVLDSHAFDKAGPTAPFRRRDPPPTGARRSPAASRPRLCSFGSGPSRGRH